MQHSAFVRNSWLVERGSNIKTLQLVVALLWSSQQEVNQKSRMCENDGSWRSNLKNDFEKIKNIVFIFF